MHTDTWIVKEVAEVNDQHVKLTLRRQGNVYGLLYLYVPFESLHKYSIGTAFEMTISPAQKAAVSAIA